MPLLARPRYRLSRRQAEVALQKFQRSWPRGLIGKMTIALFAVVHEGMTGVWVGVEIVLLIELGQLGIECPHVFGRGILIFCAEVT